MEMPSMIADRVIPWRLENQKAGQRQRPQRGIAFPGFHSNLATIT